MPVAGVRAPEVLCAALLWLEAPAVLGLALGLVGPAVLLWLETKPVAVAGVHLLPAALGGALAKMRLPGPVCLPLTQLGLGPAALLLQRKLVAVGVRLPWLPAALLALAELWLPVGVRLPWVPAAGLALAQLRLGPAALLGLETKPVSVGVLPRLALAQLGLVGPAALPWLAVKPASVLGVQLPWVPSVLGPALASFG